MFILVSFMARLWKGLFGLIVLLWLLGLELVISSMVENGLLFGGSVSVFGSGLNGECMVSGCLCMLGGSGLVVVRFLLVGVGVKSRVVIWLFLL